jgi:Outer membrane lipoprotein-sorting protein
MNMSRRLILSALLVSGVAGVVALLPGPVTAAPPSPSDPEFGGYLLTQLDDMHRGRSSHAVLSMHVKTANWERSMSMESWSLGQDHSLIRILEPKKERGTATLKSNKDLYTFLSKTGRTIKISGASMGGSWMGSHFTNDDLVRESRLDTDFDYVVKDGPSIGGEATWALILIPKPKAVVVWGKIDVMFRKSDLLPVAELFYDEDLHPVRKMEFFDFQQVGNQQVAMRMRMSPLDADQLGEYTEMTYSKLEFDVGIDPSFFSVSELKAI